MSLSYQNPNAPRVQVYTSPPRRRPTQSTTPAVTFLARTSGESRSPRDSPSPALSAEILKKLHHFCKLFFRQTLEGRHRRRRTNYRLLNPIFREFDTYMTQISARSWITPFAYVVTCKASGPHRYFIPVSNVLSSPLPASLTVSGTATSCRPLASVTTLCLPPLLWFTDRKKQHSRVFWAVPCEDSTHIATTRQPHHRL
jgi:hypothetical protein